jgi:2-hydroxychromene-2-carboxylate isomerase
MFHAAWRDGRNVGDKTVVIEIAVEAGLDRDRFAARVDAPEIKDQLKRATAAAEARGAFGVPTFFVGEQMFWGHDRMDFVARAAGLPV